MEFSGVYRCYDRSGIYLKVILLKVHDTDMPFMPLYKPDIPFNKIKTSLTHLYLISSYHQKQ